MTETKKSGKKKATSKKAIGEKSGEKEGEEEVIEETVEIEERPLSSSSGREEGEVAVEEISEEAEEERVRDEIKEIITVGVRNLKGNVSLDDFYKAIRDLNFFVSKSDECLEKGCDNPATTWGHCRLHYISNWADIKKKQTLLKTGELQDHIETLVEKHSPKFIENILTDLTSERSFFNTLKNLGIGGVEDFEEVGEDEADDDHDRDIAYETKVTARTSFNED